MKTIDTIVSLLMVVILTACATAGNKQMEHQTESSVSQVIKEGKTTKSQINAQFGNATTTSFTDSGNEIWTYRHTRAVPHARNFIPFVGIVSSGADVVTKELVIMFDKEGVVSRYTMKETEEIVNSGIAH